ncbi:hypothetical protein HYFRA_00002897 [Hymenoscyphus fraxineus]|uniref:Uncharacterized protein n=1 Tax=Hymenoscyphus fraxineus TaxID=746836 RepID=A0A9N9KRF7_9HELO|nr:hypothetical protein HYFRA_00002897 [Hymenoscyphus fraxineus]
MSGNQQHDEIPLKSEITPNSATSVAPPNPQQETPLLTTTEILSRGRQRIAALQAATTSFNNLTTSLLSNTLQPTSSRSLLWNPPARQACPNPDPPARNLRLTRRGHRDLESTIESSELWSLPGLTGTAFMVQRPRVPLVPKPAMEGLGSPLGFGSEIQIQTPTASRPSKVGFGAKVRSWFSKEKVKEKKKRKMGMKGKKGASLEELTRLAEAFVREPEDVGRKGDGSEGAKSEDEGEWSDVDLGTEGVVKRARVKKTKDL